MQSSTPSYISISWFGLLRFRSPLLTESLRFLFLRVLRCFSSPRFPLVYYFIHILIHAYLPHVGFPIRTSPTRQIFAPPRGFSQLVTSFFGFWCLGILPMLLLAWPISFGKVFSLFFSFPSLWVEILLKVTCAFLVRLFLSFCLCYP